MEASAAIAMLDRQLDQHGRDVTLRRTTRSGAVVTATFDATCRAFVRRYKPNELVGGIIQGDTEVALSPTDIDRASWPGTTSTSIDVRIPLKGDEIIEGGRPRTVQAAAPIYIGNALVRINVQVRG